MGSEERDDGPDVPLALQPMIDRVYRTGRYWLLDYAGDPPGPEWSEDERAWVDERLREAGLRA